MSFNAAAVLAQETTLLLPRFTSETAFDLGLAIRSHIKQKHPENTNVVIQITAGSTKQLYFFATVGTGSNADNGEWVERKRKSVVRWERSTAGLNGKFKGVLPKWAGEDVDYAIHGGGFPLRVEGVEPLVGIVVVSGLKQEDDHAVICETLEKFISTLKN